MNRIALIKVLSIRGFGRNSSNRRKGYLFQGERMRFMAVEQGEALVRLGAFIGGGVALGVGAAGAAIADGIAGSQLVAGIARQPEAQGRLMNPFLLAVS